jgi:hypothetical protein
MAKIRTLFRTPPALSGGPFFERRSGRTGGHRRGHGGRADAPAGALDAYKRGVELLRQCQATLSAAEQQIRILEGDELREFDPAARDGTGNVAAKQG